MADPSYDLVVIGAGPGGYTAAVRAADLGMSVACVDRGWLGGTCLQVGCIPSKALLESSERFAEVQAGFDDHGIALSQPELDLSAMMARKSRIVDTMTKGVAWLFADKKVEYVEGSAHVPNPGRVDVERADGSTTMLRAQRILLATGSVPAQLPDLPFDGERIISSNEALSLTRVPERLIVVGAGAIGLEMGSVWSRLGAEVRVVEFLDSILPGMDAEITKQGQRVLSRQGLSFDLGTRATGAEVFADGVRLSLVHRDGDKERVEECDLVLVAVGRRSTAVDLDLDKLGVKSDDRGLVAVNGDYATNVVGIYAIGDLVPGPMLAHKAEAEGVVAVERMAGYGSSVNYDAMPAVVYTHPEVAAVGLSEEAAQEAGYDVQIGKHQFRANGRAYAMDCLDGFVKVVADAASDRVLGMHILGPQASHLIAEGVLAIELSASVEDLARTVHAHPSLSEVIKEAAWHIAE
ncbi:MAG: dihydrolipoyl dehydrogenase [Candidatus Latescibacterota bacterium]|nr:dihydrolipoyl dehydrogenase [Candidatus Latescibacterota bacterium]